MLRRLLVMCSLAALAVLAPAQSSQQPETGAPNAKEGDFAQLRQQWAENLRQKRLDACVAQYAGDAEFLQPDGSRASGTSAIRQLFKTVTETLDSDLTFDSVKVDTSGDLAYDSGTYRETLTVRATGKRLLATGSYLTVYRRQPNREWLIVQQMWSGSTKGD